MQSTYRQIFEDDFVLDNISVYRYKQALQSLAKLYDALSAIDLPKEILDQLPATFAHIVQDAGMTLSCTTDEVKNA